MGWSELANRNMSANLGNYISRLRRWLLKQIYVLLNSQCNLSLLKYNSDHWFLCKWTMHGKSPSIITGPNTVQNQSKLIDLVIRIKLTRAILMPRLSQFSEKFDHLLSHVFVLGNMFSDNHGLILFIKAYLCALITTELPFSRKQGLLLKLNFCHSRFFEKHKKYKIIVKLIVVIIRKIDNFTIINLLHINRIVIT